jgi:2'-5' RNA ligase
MDSAGPVRAFFALPLGPGARNEIERTLTRFANESWAPGVRWVPPENLHITLRFLGDLEPGPLEAITREARHAVARAPRIECRLERITAFPRSSRARVIVASLAPKTALTGLAGDLERVARNAGLEADDHPFRPHVTLGRVRKPPLRGVELEEPLSPCPFEPVHVALYRSRLGRGGARYEALESFPIGRA